MLTVGTLGKIRRDHFVHGKSIKSIVGSRGVSRNTVHKALRAQETTFSYERALVVYPKLGPHLARLEGLLEENAGKTKRERLTLMRLFEQLRAEGYAGSYEAVRRYTKTWQQRRGSTVSDAYVALVFAPGEVYQFDWSHEMVVIDGVTTTAKVTHLRVSHSPMAYVRAYPRGEPGDGEVSGGPHRLDS